MKNKSAVGTATKYMAIGVALMTTLMQATCVWSPWYGGGVYYDPFAWLYTPWYVY